MFLAGVWTLSVVLAIVTSLCSGSTKLCIQWPEDGAYNGLPQTVNMCKDVIEAEGPICSMVLPVINFGTFFVPMIIIAVLNTKIVLALKARPRVHVRQDINMININIRNQVTRSLVILVTLFFVLQSPFRYAGVIQKVSNENTPGSVSYQPNLIATGRIFVSVDSAINTLVYLFTSSHYRRCFVETFRGRARIGVSNQPNRPPTRACGNALDENVTTNTSRECPFGETGVSSPPGRVGPSTRFYPRECW